MTRRTAAPRRGRAAVALALVPLTLAGCSFIPDLGSLQGENAGGGTGEVSVNVLYAAGDSGGVAQQTISVEPSEDDGLRIDFSENEVTGFGDMTRAASWNAVTVATLLTGTPLDRQYRFSFDGAIDGPSAGALTTAAVLSLVLGDELDPAVTMTGTINPTGTIGTVGGIPEKIQGVIDDGEISTVLIPAGQRNSPDFDGELVDVVDLGAEGDVQVREVATIYDAYRELTGEELPAPSASTPQLSEAGYDKLESGATEALARFDRASAEYDTLDPAVRANAEQLVAFTRDRAARARDLQVQGLQAGAFVEAQAAAMEMQAIFNTFDTVQSMLLQGFGVLDAKLAGGSATIDEFNAHIDSLGTYTPESLTDVEALVTSYGNAFDAYSLLTYATNVLEGLYQRAEAGEYESLEALLTDVLIPLIYFEFARGQLEFARAVFDIGRDNEGGPIAEDVDLEAIGSFLRRGADANWAAFETGVLAPNAEAEGVSTEVFRNELAAIDTTVALAYSARFAQEDLAQYIGEGEPNAAYAAMGYGYLNYARNAILLEKYYNNGVLDENLMLVDVQSDTILSAALDLGRDQVSRALSILDAQGTTSVLSAGAFEQAGVDREGDVNQKFNAIAQYSGAFMLGRAMAFVGGFPEEGWRR